MFLPLVASLFLYQCKESKDISTIPIVHVQNTAETNHSFVEDLEITGLSVLASPSNELVRSIDNVLFDDHHLYVVDADTDFHALYVYDESGKFVRKIGNYSETAAESYTDISGVCIHDGTVSILSSGNRKILNYDTQGKLLSEITTGVIGDALERDDEGNYYVYNEHVILPVSENYSIVVFDKSGNLISRQMPFDKGKNNWGSGFSGFMIKNNGQILCSPVYSDTIFAIHPKNNEPYVEFDFGAGSIPTHLKNKKISGFEVDPYSFLNEYVAVGGNHVLFEYQNQSRICHGAYNMSTGAMTQWSRDNILAKLLLNGSVIHKEKDEFAVILRSEQIKGFLQQNNINEAELDHFYPGLGAKILSAAGNNQPAVIYFRFKN